MSRKELYWFVLTAAFVSLIIYFAVTSRAFGEMRVKLVDSKNKTICEFSATSMKGVTVPGGIDISIFTASGAKINCVSSAPVSSAPTPAPKPTPSPAPKPSSPYPDWMKPTPKKGN